jgi:16S rRNA (adenine1518-N6/adenine1519-N6)-dimethyltransferase
MRKTVPDAPAVRPKKWLGQHFLRDRGVARALAEAAQIRPGDPVLEIGGGTGVVTAELVPRCDHLWVVEVDRSLAAALAERWEERPGVTVLAQDILTLDLKELFTSPPGIVVGSLPYRLSTPILKWWVAQKEVVRRGVFLVQREVAERIVAAPGGRDYGRLSVLLQYHATADLVRRVGAGCFFPRPRVESALILLEMRPQPAVRVADPERFFTVVEYSFRQRRKMLGNALQAWARQALGLEPTEVEARLSAAGIDPRRRGETLSLEEFAAVAEALSA